MSGDMGNPEVPRDDEARAFPPPPPPAQRVTPMESVVDGDIPGASVSPIEEADAAETPASMPDDLAVSADLAMARVDDLDIPPAEIAVPDFAIPEPPEIPPLDPTAAELLEDDSAGVSSEVPPPATRSELRARTTAGESGDQPPAAGRRDVPDSASPPAPAASGPGQTTTAGTPRPYAGSESAAAAPEALPAQGTVGDPAFAPIPGAPAMPSAQGAPTAPPPFGAGQPPAAFAPAAPFGQGTEPPASDPSNPRGGDTYRGWPIVVFLALAALLIAAVIGIIVLVNNPPSIVASEDSGTEAAEPVTVDAASDSGCSDLCAEIAAVTKSRITGPNDGVVWTMGEEWRDAARVLPRADQRPAGPHQCACPIMLAGRYAV